MPSTNLEKIYTSPYRSFNFQQLFFYDIFCATRILRVIGRQSIRQSTNFFLLIFWHNKKKTSKIKFIKTKLFEWHES